jgi:hypothetical protein
MRKAKLILSGIALFAVVGGSFAFKAHRGISSYCRIAAQPGVCTTTYVNTSFSTTTIPTFGVTTYCTLIPGAQCTATVTSTFIRG